MSDLHPPSPDDEHLVPAPPLGQRSTRRGAIVCVAVCTALLALLGGAALRDAGERLAPGWQRTMVLAAGKPAGWLSEATGADAVTDRLVAWIRPSDELDVGGAFASSAGPAVATPGAGGAAAPTPVGPDAFDPRTLGLKPGPAPELKTVLVTGDSLAQPLDAKVAEAFADAGGDVRVLRDPHLGTGISQTDLLDWGRLSTTQARRDQPQAVVMFMGANEGFPLPDARGNDVACCDARWAAIYATRARTMMNTYRRGGDARVYWLLLPAQRDPARQRIARVVNAALRAAAQPYLAQVRIVDLGPLLTPHGRFQSAIDVGGRERIVRESDGIHLNDTGAEVALGPVLDALRADFGARVPRP